MSASRVELTWDPDDQRKRVRRNAAVTVIVLAGLLWVLARAETPDGGKISTDTSTTTTTAKARTATSDTTATTDTTATATATIAPQPPAVPSLSPQPAKVDFGDHPVGTTADQTVTFKNDGTVPFAANAIAFAGTKASAFEVSIADCAGVQPDKPCPARIVFRPAIVGDATAEVALIDASGARSTAVILSGRGTEAPNAPPPPPPAWHRLQFETPLIEVPLGTKVPVTIRNAGEDEATFGTVTVDDTTMFSVDPATCQSKRKLPPGDTCEVVITSSGDQAVHTSNVHLFNAEKRQEDVAAAINRALQQPVNRALTSVPNQLQH